jgi:hypothetical protein
MASRSYSSGVVAALMSLSRGTCCWPDCGTRVIRFVDDEPALQVQIAHIRALNPGGPRYDHAMTDRQRNSFASLVLLCVVHHNRVDRDHGEYSVERLVQWKQDAERRSDHAMRGLADIDWTGVNDRLLEEVIVNAFDQQLDRLHDAVTRLEDFDSEAAALIRPLIDELAAARISRPVLNEDMIELLHSSSRQLTGLEDTVVHLSIAAERLEKLPGWIDELNAAGENLRAYPM